MGINISDNNISDEFGGQGYRSKVKVAILKNVTFGDSEGLTYVYILNECYKDYGARILTKRARRGRAVNAQAFSFCIK